MAASKADTYLHRPTGIAGTWYARVTVPRTLVKYVGQTHIRRSLKTTDRAEANRRKHAVVGEIKAELERLRRAPEDDKRRGISFAEAEAWREQLKAAEGDRLDHNGKHAVLHGLLMDRAWELQALHGDEMASRWLKAAVAPSTEGTLAGLMDTWLKVSEFKASTNSAHRKALAEVLAYLKNDHAVPADVTLLLAVAYIDNDLTQRRLAHNTIRDRLVSLGGFWKWMESRGAVSKGSNPWTGHRINKKDNKGRSPPKREYTDDELLRLLAANDRVKKWPTYAYIPDLIVLGMFTGARIESLCALPFERIDQGKDRSVLTIINDKNEAGERLVGVTHPAPLAVLKRRLKGKKAGDMLFPELHPGGYDEKLSASATKAYGRYRRACGVPDGTDFHSLRRNVNTILENAEATQVAIARFVGHKIGTESGDTYSKGAATRNTLATSKKVRYSAKVEKAVIALAKVKYLGAGATP
jgi:integrase